VCCLASVLSVGGAHGEALKRIDSRIKKVFLIQLSHLDIGFTGTPGEVAEQHAACLSQVLAEAERRPEFRWNIETTWQLEQFIARSDPPQVERLMAAIRRGQIGVGACYASMHSGVMSPEELCRLLYAGERLRARHDIPIRIAVQNDVPGYTWALASVLADAGLDGLVVGANRFIGGSADIPPSDMPFYWEGPDGKRILTWISQEGYLEGAFKYGLVNMQAAEDRLPGKLREWEEAGYQHDAILVIHGTGDNRAVQPQWTDFIDEWNTAYATPKLVNATLPEFFDYLREEYGDDFPVYGGDWSGRWDPIVCGEPFGLSLVREARRQGGAGEALCALQGAGDAGSRRSMSLALEQSILQFDEHSGAGTGWPKLTTKEQVEETNREVMAFAEAARAASDELLDTGLDALAARICEGGERRERARPIMVFNALSWPRDGLVEVETGRDDGESLVRTGAEDLATGQRLPAEIDGGVLRFVARDVPSYGYRVYDVCDGDPPTRAPVGPRVPGTIATPAAAVEIDPRTGSILALRRLPSGADLIDHASRFPQGGAIVATHAEAIGGKWAAVGAMETQVSRRDTDLTHSIAVVRRGSPHSETTWRVVDGLPWIEVTHVLERSAMPYVRRDGHSSKYAFTLPLRLREPEYMLDYAAGPTRPTTDFLPGAFRGTFTPMDGCAIIGEGAGALVAQRQSTVTEFGAIQDFVGWPPPEPTFTSRVWSKADEGHFRDDTMGPVMVEPGAPDQLSFQYAIAPTDHWDAIEATRFWRGFAQPLTARVLNGSCGGETTLAGSLLRVDAPNVAIVGVKAAENGDAVVIRLLELAGRETVAVLSSDALSFSRANRATVLERPIESLECHRGKTSVSMRGHELATIVVECRPAGEN